MVVLGPGFFGGSVRAHASLAGNKRGGGESADEGFYFGGVDVFGEISDSGALEAREVGRDAGGDFLGGYAVCLQIDSWGKRRERGGGENCGDADADFGFAEAFQAGDYAGGGRCVSNFVIQGAEE